ncbi:unnamed protein product [Vicia faba]|uniref:Uncharacterized protein n=1 Tax=Vicia faba TaxID=3906 RepID=A0AAV0ZKT4_VICFA|nr:unnamed protein product [Vicia faba]
MNLVPFQSAPLLEPMQFPVLPPKPPNSSSFWETRNVCGRFWELQDTLNLVKGMQKEQEMLKMIRDRGGSLEGLTHGSNGTYLLSFLKYVVDEASPWEEKSAVARFTSKVHKSKRNQLWRKKKRKRIAEIMDHEWFAQIDQEADEWRAMEIAKETEDNKVKKMKEIAKLKVKEEKKKLESQLELLLVVEKLQELRSIRIQKLKKQGHFLPEEDDRFLERVQAAVEEEEREALAAAETDDAKDEIAIA